MRFHQLAVKSMKGLQPESLPPTDDAALQHSLRVYLQIHQWKSLMEDEIDPTKWGWKECENQLEPVMMTMVRLCFIV